jgi:hypothetical protein
MNNSITSRAAVVGAPGQSKCRGLYLGHGSFFLFLKRSCLRHYATSRKVAGSIPNETIGFFIDLIPLAALWPWGRLSL